VLRDQVLGEVVVEEGHLEFQVPNSKFQVESKAPQSPGNLELETRNLELT
jgi:hypothetical protein